MKKLFSTIALLVVMAVMAAPGSAQSFGDRDAQGVWTFFVHIDGAPPCQCIQIGRFNADGTVDAPGADNFTGAGLGLWQKTGFNTVSFAILQNSFNQDGSAGGEYVIRGTMTLNPTADQGTGTSTFQVLGNDGKVMFSGTAKFTATKLKL